MIEVEAINIQDRLVLLSDGEVISITYLVDANGERTEDGDEAVTVAAGPTQAGKWLAIRLDDFEFMREQ